MVDEDEDMRAACKSRLPNRSADTQLAMQPFPWDPTLPAHHGRQKTRPIAVRTSCITGKIEPDLFGLLGGRETYVVDAKGVVVGTHRSQFDPASHVTESLESIKSFPKSPFDVDFKQLAGILGVNVY